MPIVARPSSPPRRFIAVIAPAPHRPPHRAPRRVVVTGIGVLSPNGNGREPFWRATRSGESGVARIGSFDPVGLDCQIAGEIRRFDPADHVPPKERFHVPRVVPLALASAREALDDARLLDSENRVREPRTMGVVIGTGGGGVEFTERQYEHYFRNEIRKASVYVIPSSTPGTLSSEISIAFGIKGMSHVISDGCTSSTDAIGYAFHLIRHGRIDRVVTGGVDSTISRGIMTGFCLMKVLSTARNHEPTRASRPFDRARDGFVLGEGSWILILEERERALERGAPVYAEVLGYGATCDAYHRVRLDDTGEEPARAMGIALEEAGRSPAEVGYVALHGTSTRLNDVVETRAIRRCFGPFAERIPMSALKSIIGHPQGASGAAGVVSTILGMRDGILHPTLNLDDPDPECDLDYIPHRGRRIDLELALCNCIGFGSKNAALAIARHQP
jgi:3-oxoacyl-[acyl-carrier-protein] synthase II